MKEKYHILNGDALLGQLPDSIIGKKIVARECLVEGTVEGESLQELFAHRAAFISTTYPDVSRADYYEKTVTEFTKIQSIPTDAEIILWFEDDLFCQVNFWFVIQLLSESHKQSTIYLIRPQKHTRYGFGGLSEAELLAIHASRMKLSDIAVLAQLWSCYREGDLDGLLSLAKNLQSSYPFILPAVQAHIERQPTESNLGRPTQALINIMKELDTEEFGPVFSAFCDRESIYGYGDSQVSRLLDQIRADREGVDL